MVSIEKMGKVKERFYLTAHTEYDKVVEGYEEKTLSQSRKWTRI